MTGLGDAVGPPIRSPEQNGGEASGVRWSYPRPPLAPRPMLTRLLVFCLVSLALSGCTRELTVEDVALVDVQFDDGTSNAGVNIRGILENRTSDPITTARVHAVFRAPDGTVIERPYITAVGIAPSERARIKVPIPLDLVLSGEPFMWALTHVDVKFDRKWHTIELDHHGSAVSKSVAGIP